MCGESHLVQTRALPDGWLLLLPEGATGALFRSLESSSCLSCAEEPAGVGSAALLAPPGRMEKLLRLGFGGFVVCRACLEHFQPEQLQITAQEALELLAQSKGGWF